jgi:hypothetical protein
MTEPSSDDSSTRAAEAVEQAAHPSRFLIYRNGVDRPLCKITWVEGENQTQLTGGFYEEGKQDAEQVTALLREALGPARGRLLTPEEASEVWTRIRDVLGNGGYRVEEMPGSDIRMQLSVDLETGRIVGRSEVLHAGAARNSELESSIADGIKRALLKKPDQVVSQIAAAVLSNDHVGAAKVLAEGLASTLVAGPDSSAHLRQAAERIDLSLLEPTARQEILEIRIGLAAMSRSYGAAYRTDVQNLITEFGEKIPPEKRAHLDVALGLAELHAGNRETAYALWLNAARNEVATATYRCSVTSRTHEALRLHDPQPINSSSEAIVQMQRAAWSASPSAPSQTSQTWRSPHSTRSSPGRATTN